MSLSDTSSTRPDESRFMRILRFMATVSLIVSICLVMLESGAYIFGRMQGMTYGDLATIKELHLKSLHIEDKDQQDNREAEVRFSGRRQLHPYFGYTMEPGFNGSHNNLGFLSAHDYPYQAADDEFVVGIFGGSVALQVGSSPITRRNFESTLLKEVERKGYRRVTVLCFALGAYRQPQTFLPPFSIS